MRSLSEYAASLSISSEKMGIVEFAESKFGLGLKLFPAQKFFLRLLTGEQLDDSTKVIPIKDRFAETTLDLLTEMEYYRFLESEKRISCSYEDVLKNYNKIIQYNFCMGRRASKSVMISIYTAYTLYSLLLHKCPQEYVSVPSSSKLGIIMVGLSQDSSMTLFSTFYGLIKDSIFFKKHILEDTNKTGMCFWSLKDLEAIDKGLIQTKGSHTFEISAVPNSPGVRGSSNIIAIFDEFAHFGNSPHSTKDKPMDKFIYEAISPSISSFVDPEGNPVGRLFIISSPNGKHNKFYSDFENALTKSVTDTYTLAVRAPTWEVNTQVNSAFFKHVYNSDVSSYEQEYAAEFIEGGLNWIKDLESIYYCVENRRQPENDICSDLTKPHFIGLDFGLSNDGTSMCICHFEPKYIRNKESFTKEAYSYSDFLSEKTASQDILDEGVFVIDFIKYLKPGLPPFEKHKVLDVNIVIDSIDYLFTKYPIHFGIFDQWSGAIISDLLSKRGLDKKIEMVSHTQTINDSQYKLFSQLLHTKKIVFPNYPSLIKEILALKVEFNANGTIKVENKSSHDDRFDSIIRALYVCYSYYNKPENMSGVFKSSRFFTSNPRDLIQTTSESVRRNYHRKAYAMHNGRP